MIKSISATPFVTALSSANVSPLGIIFVFLAGCTTTQATGMRQQVMKYYNDEIMENLIRVDQNLPFVHVDITGLTTIETSQISGTVASGETRSFDRTSRSMAGAFATLARGVMRPFSYSVAPQRGNSLQISAAPALGKLSPESDAPESGSTELVTTKITEVRDSPGSPITHITTEKTPRPAGKTQTISIYDLYEDFVDQNRGTAFCWTDGLSPPPPQKYVPGTLKRWGRRFYYIDNGHRERYYNFCRSLFTKGQAHSFAKQIEATETAIEGVRGLQAIPAPPPSPP